MRIKEDLDYKRYTKCRIDLWAIFETEYIELGEWQRRERHDFKYSNLKGNPAGKQRGDRENTFVDRPGLEYWLNSTC